MLFFQGDGTTANMEHFTKCDDIQAYIPKIEHPSLPGPLVAADVKTFNPSYLSFEQATIEDYKMMSLYNSPELPGFSEEEKKLLFSEVVFFPPPKDFKEDVYDDSTVSKYKKGGYDALPEK